MLLIRNRTYPTESRGGSSSSMKPINAKINFEIASGLWPGFGLHIFDGVGFGPSKQKKNVYTKYKFTWVRPNVSFTGLKKKDKFHTD